MDISVKYNDGRLLDTKQDLKIKISNISGLEQFYGVYYSTKTNATGLNISDTNSSIRFEGKPEAVGAMLEQLVAHFNDINPGHKITVL